MDELEFWRQKLLQILHDPPAKPFAMIPGAKGAALGGHKKVAERITSLLAGTSIKYFKGYPDYVMAGADRPIFPGGKGKVERVQVRWPDTPWITHPLSPGYRLLLSYGGIDGATAGTAIRDEVLEIEDGTINELTQSTNINKAAPDVWTNASTLHNRFLTVWRKLRHLMTQYGSDGDKDPRFRHLWQTMPADGRCPDHSIWEHNRLTSALAFMTEAKGDDAPRAPWLFRFEIGPVGSFIGEARTSRDLWMGSFLLADLIWHGMLPIIELYGPDCIIYPDLRGNPLADLWLQETHPEALPEGEDPATYAAVLPNVFTAVLPLGHRDGSTYLPPLEDLAAQAKQSVQERWKKLASIVEQWLADAQNSGSSDEWRQTWRRQHQQVIHSTWSAVRWSKMETIVHPESLTFTDPLPCQHDRETKIGEEALKRDRAAIDSRERRLRPFVSKEVWAHYNQTRAVFARTNLPVHQLERGFDYALTHHQLLVRHALRKQEAAEAGIAEEPGEKCTVCGRRQALYNRGKRADKLHSHREAAREFWSKARLNPDPRQQDRLCGVCAMKRYLVEAGVDRESGLLTGINPVWAGHGQSVAKLKFSDDKARVPFPSTATVAAQKFIEAVCREPSLAPFLAAVVRDSARAGLPRTGFARALHRLAALETDSVAAPFLMLDTQGALFPETLDILIRDATGKRDGNKPDALEQMKKSVAALRSAARRAGLGNPGTRIAVIRLDGDRMGRLLLGDPDIIQTTWRDVIHPEAVHSPTKSSLLTAQVTRDAAWPDLLDCKRLMGPSLHAFISRSLALFSHRIVPWVVEREFSGRLIYCGGDDILAMAPADEALGLVARLQQLFSAPFILDTTPEETAWGWRQPGSGGEHDDTAARHRFLIPKRPDAPGQGILLPFNAEEMEAHAAGDGANVSGEQDGEILTMLGKGYSLSAGIAYGHFKTPLSDLLRQSKEMLAEWAKGRSGRAAVGLSHSSRNGVKTRFAMSWGSEGESANVRRFQLVVKGFRDGTLPKRLPYKLRDYHRLLGELGPATDDEAARLLIKGLFTEAVGVRDRWTPEIQAAFDLWWQGLHLNGAMTADIPDQAADGLGIARMLSAEEDEA